ncbi:MAG: hypothetical protein K2N13_00960 [Paraprevotella sp.]|nr:hypothetical protein [Paraprevotella sp.]
MKHIEIKTTTQTKTEVTINGENVENFLKDVCNLAHQALIELSMYRHEHNLPDYEFDGIEGKFCALLDKLGD